MEKVNDYKELSKLIFSNLKKDVITNSFISKEEFENEIKQGNLYYISFEDGLFILRDRGDFYILNYYLRNAIVDEVAEIIKTIISKPLIVEVVGKNEEDLNYLKTIQLFINIGMNVAIKRERFSKKKLKSVNETCKRCDDNTVSSVDNTEPTINYCEMQDFESVQELLNSNFNKYYGCIPNSEKLKLDIISNNLYKATLNNKIIGILHIRKSDNNSEIRHLAVDELYRNRGVANKLIQKYDKDLNDNKTVWTGKENTTAQKVYEKNGYKKDGYISVVLTHFIIR